MRLGAFIQYPNNEIFKWPGKGRIRQKTKAAKAPNRVPHCHGLNSAVPFWPIFRSSVLADYKPCGSVRREVDHGFNSVKCIS